MVLLSGNNKSVSQQTNDERSKTHTVTVIHNSHHQGNKSADSGRPQSLHNASLTKGMSTMDEFKYGFPSEGLSTTSNKWWGSKDHDDCGGAKQDRTKDQPEEKSREAENVASETGNAGSNETPQGAALLTAVRKRAVEEGREALKLGVFRGYGENKLGRREKTLLRQIFRSSLPSSWIPDL